MADQSDVEAVLVNLASSALYPAGVAQVSAVGPVCRVFRGWPHPAVLDADLAAGRVAVSVFAVAGDQRNTTRYGDEWIVLPSVPALTVSVDGITVYFGGNADVGQLAGVLADGRSYVYRTQAGDSPAMVAANLATLMRADRVVNLAGSAIIVPGAGRLVARVVADQRSVLETRRQEQGFRVAVWCADPGVRDAACACVDAAFSEARFIALPDGSAGRMRFRESVVTDRAENAALYRRDLVYAVEYPTTVTTTSPAMLFGDSVLDGASAIG